MRRFIRANVLKSYILLINFFSWVLLGVGFGVFIMVDVDGSIWFWDHLLQLFPSGRRLLPEYWLSTSFATSGAGYHHYAKKMWVHRDLILWRRSSFVHIRNFKFKSNAKICICRRSVTRFKRFDFIHFFFFGKFGLNFGARKQTLTLFNELNETTPWKILPISINKKLYNFIQNSICLQ